MNYRLTYIPRGILAPTAREICSMVIWAQDARHAALRALSYERRSGNRVLTVKEENGK